MAKLSPERDQIARYLGRELHELYLRDEHYFVAGVAWAIGRILGEPAKFPEPEPTESLDEFLRGEETDGNANG